MTRLFRILFTLVLAATPAVAAERPPSAEASEGKPNVLFIMSDDHTAQAVGAYATVLKDLNPTPTIDTLAAEGITFENAFCTNAICTPSRACIITGQYPHVNGVTDTFESIATRGHNDELMPHIGTSIGKRNPRRSYAVDLFRKFPEEFPKDYHLAKDPDELNNVYDESSYASVREQLKREFAKLRTEVGDDGSHHPACEAVVQEFWDYTDADRAKAIEISHEFKARREAELAKRKNGKKK